MKAFENKRSGLLTSVDLRQPRIKVGYWIVFAILCLVALIFLLPVLWVAISCFKDSEEFFMIPPTIIPNSFHPGKLVEVWKEWDFGRYYLNTLLVSCGDVCFAVFFNGLAGYVISRLRPKGSKLLFTIILWTMMMPSSVSMVPLYMTWVDFPIFHFSLMNSYLPIWLGKGANAYYVLLFKSFFDGISDSLIEAAEIDGCTKVGIFIKVVLPLSLPIVTTVAIFTFNVAWADFMWPYLLLQDKSLFTVPLEIFKVKISGIAQDKYIILLFFSIIPMLIIFLLFQKQIMQGINIGGVKG